MSCFLFKLATCLLLIAASLVSPSDAIDVSISLPFFHTGSRNDFDGHQYVQGMSSNGDIAPLCGVQSDHDNYREDRRFTWACCSILSSTYNKVVTTSTLSITGLDEKWTRECPINQVLISVTSTHYGHEEDRKFVFGCAGFASTKKESCYWTSYVNDFDAYMHFTCPPSYVIGGITSEHNNYPEDRRFAFKCCKLAVV